jgi:anti-sigma-K factor RskA
MNDRREPPHQMLDEVAVYALGALPAADAAAVRAHIATCRRCADEYAKLKPVAALVGISAETPGDAADSPSALLKPRIMTRVRASKAAPPVRMPAAPSRTPVWPAYLVAAACVAIAIVSSMWNVALVGQVRQAQQEIARVSQRSDSLARALEDQRTMLSDLMGSGAKRYAANDGEVIMRGSHAYIAMHDLPQPPRGKVYQAWTLPKGSTKMVPSLTFVPDAHGVAVVSLPPDAHSMAVIAVSVEPDGGSKQPTTKPILVVPLT